MADETSRDLSLNETQQAQLAALLDTLLPASEEVGMPSAAEVGFERYMQTQARDFAHGLLEFLQSLDAGFAALPPDVRHERVSSLHKQRPAEFTKLLARVYDCYYQDDRVRRKIGVVAGPVFPQGNEIIQGDLSLLDPVIANRDRYTYRKP